MTVEKMIIEVYEMLGEPSDLNPYTSNVFDFTTAGAVRILEWINRAYKTIAYWKLSTGRLLRFPSTYAEYNFQTAYYTGTVASATSTTITLSASQSTTADYYNNWIIEISAGTGSGQYRYIVDYSANRIATINKTWNTTPDGTSTFKLYKRFMKLVDSTATDAVDNISLNPNTQLLSVIKIIDLYDGTDLTLADRVETFAGNLVSSGTPSSYYHYNNQIVFDYAIAENRWYKMEYVKILDNLTLSTDTPLLPEQFHDAIVLWAFWWGLVRNGEDQSSYARKRDVQELMTSLATSVEYEHEKENEGMIINQ